MSDFANGTEFNFHPVIQCIQHENINEKMNPIWLPLKRSSLGDRGQQHVLWQREGLQRREIGSQRDRPCVWVHHLATRQQIWVTMCRAYTNPGDAQICEQWDEGQSFQRWAAGEAWFLTVSPSGAVLKQTWADTHKTRPKLYLTWLN